MHHLRSFLLIHIVPSSFSHISFIYLFFNLFLLIFFVLLYLWKFHIPCCLGVFSSNTIEEKRGEASTQLCAQLMFISLQCVEYHLKSCIIILLLDYIYSNAILVRFSRCSQQNNQALHTILFSPHNDSHISFHAKILIWQLNFFYIHELL